MVRGKARFYPAVFWRQEQSDSAAFLPDDAPAGYSDFWWTSNLPYSVVQAWAITYEHRDWGDHAL
jgi:hypothetical protein